MTGRAILFKTLVHEGDDFMQRLGVEPQLARDTPDQFVDALDMQGAAEESSGSG